MFCEINLAAKYFNIMPKIQYGAILKFYYSGKDPEPRPPPEFASVKMISPPFQSVFIYSFSENSISGNY